MLDPCLARQPRARWSAACADMSHSPMHFTCHLGFIRRVLRLAALVLLCHTLSISIASAETFLYRLRCWNDYPTQVNTGVSGTSASRVLGGVHDGHCSTTLTNLLPGVVYRLHFAHIWDPSGCPEDYIETSFAGSVLGRVYNFVVTECTDSPDPGVNASVTYEFTANATSGVLTHAMHNGLTDVVRHCIARYVDVYIVAPPPEPFEILSATCDSSSYENGQGVVNLDVTIKNNWGPESSDLAVRVFSPQVFTADVVATTALLPRGQTTILPLSFLAPSPGMNISYDLEIILNGSSHGLQDVFVGRQLNDQELAQMEQETLACLPPGQSCSMAVMGMVPYAGGVANAISVVAAACDIAAATETGDVLRAAVGSADIALATFSAVTDYIAPPAGNVASFVASVIQAGIDCSFEAIRGTIGGTKSGVANADSLATALQLSLDAMGAAYSNQVIIHGPARLRIHSGDSFTDGDTLGVKRVIVANVDSTQYSWAFIGTGPVPLGVDPATNPNSAVLTEVFADSSGWLDVAIVHRTASGTVRQIRYQPFVVTATTKCQLSLEDGTEDFSLRVDFNGDGQVDSLVYSEGTSDVPDWHDPSIGVSGIGRTEVRPNPFNGSTTMSFGVVGVIHGARVEIWNASGRRVRTIGLGDLAPGTREVAWDGAGDDGKRLAGGIYFCQVSYRGGRSEPRKSILLR